ncbi:MAG: hypothetical protein GXO93_02055 [FCB group bacterium]|nr:hypothetical protein [FCB group bacterium]
MACSLQNIVGDGRRGRLPVTETCHYRKNGNLLLDSCLRRNDKKGRTIKGFHPPIYSVVGRRPRLPPFIYLTAWIEYYNEKYLHSALGYMPPNQYEETYNKSHKTLLEIA